MTNFMPMCSVRCFVPDRVQTEAQWIEVVLHSTKPRSRWPTMTMLPFRWKSPKRCHNNPVIRSELGDRNTAATHTSPSPIVAHA